MGRAFQFAGCSSILTSLWTVDDRSTSQFMQLFYAHLNLGLSKTEALQKARIQYLEATEPTHAHPFFWAGFVLMGDGDPIPDHGVSYWMWVFMGIAGLSLGLLFLYRRQAG